MNEIQTSYALPDVGLSKEAMRLCRFIDRLPKEGKFIITLEKVNSEWQITITEIKIEKVIQVQVMV